MTVIAGCSLFNGVLLLADSRQTIPLQNGRMCYFDNIQKLFPLTPTIAIGFSGNIYIAGQIIKNLLIKIKANVAAKGRIHTVELLQWLPRYCRFYYRKLSKAKREEEIVHFLIAAVNPGCPNIIEYSKAKKLMERFRSENLSMQRNWVPGILMQSMKNCSDKNLKEVNLTGTVQGILYCIKSPDFDPKYYKCLDYEVIGSGEKSKEGIEDLLDWIFAGDVGDPGCEFTALREAVKTYIEEHKDDPELEKVGGTFYGIVVEGKESGYIVCSDDERAIGGRKTECSFDQRGHIIEKDFTSGKEIKLSFPWELK